MLSSRQLKYDVRGLGCEAWKFLGKKRSNVSGELFSVSEIEDTGQLSGDLRLKKRELKGYLFSPFISKLVLICVYNVQ